MLEWIERAQAEDVDVLAFPELATVGYPPEDLLFRTDLLRANLEARDQIVAASTGMVVIFGFVDCPDDIYNAAAIACDGALAGIYHKHFLPNYGVFDENRYFQAGLTQSVFSLGNVKLGVNICEDIWYPGGPADEQALIGGAHVIVNISASPYYAGKIDSRDRMVAVRAADNDAVVALVNLVGGQDELVFDGGSVVYDEAGQVRARGKQFEEDLVVTDIHLDPILRSRLRDPRRRKEKFDSLQRRKEMACIGLNSTKQSHSNRPTDELPSRLGKVEEIYNALTLGVRDYVDKNGFNAVVVALSGGIDSALTVAIAVDALGKERVAGVTMPSRFNSNETQNDAAALAANLGIRFITLPIEPVVVKLLETLAEPFAGLPADTTEENLQARVRGNIVMALSNKFGWLVLTTGNKSEMSVGYATLYGDMAGGFAVIKDVYKTSVYELSEWRNAKAGFDLIPRTTIDRAPSAELRENQTDQDSLPPYDILDSILEAYVELDESTSEITARGFDEATVLQVMSKVDFSEYKRRQAPPGVKITPRAFGKDRRLPITKRMPR
jgi:NAD+ synthase (glutamine-hydrolysing)